MQHVDYEQQRPIYSQSHKQHQKVSEFKEYLVKSNAIQHFIKFLFGLRTKMDQDQGVPNEDALAMFQDYFGTLTPDTTEQEALKEEIKQAKNENEQLRKEIEGVKEELNRKTQERERAAEEKRLREQEEAKNPKKGGKK